jgi:NADH-quinone oxidoreductase subunit L
LTALALATLGAPLAGFLINAFLGRTLARRAIGWVGAGSIFVAFASALGIIRGVMAGHSETVQVYDWIAVSDLRVPFNLLLDPLSAVMLFVITGVGFLIHWYSIGYMAKDPGLARFFAYMNLFVFSMLLLVLAANFLWLIVGWALVGLCSYLLIGFWYERRAAVLAARKAFVMNVIGDVGLVFAAILLFLNLKTLDYASAFAAAPKAFAPGGSVITAITLLLLLGAVAKSAQLPLHTWLPDAMEGPTPVSALIHAATMVTAGVYLVARMHGLYELAPFAAGAVAAIGAGTALMAATIALVQVDIKRVLAYSTMSQIGYMFTAVGIGAYAAGMFHLMTHAFFKALLFMAAGNVIHAFHDQQDIRVMGRLRQALPVTWVTFLAGTLSISGVPLLAGFFSKEAILGAAFTRGPAVPWLWAILALTAALTGFYMFRLFFVAFGLEPSGSTPLSDDRNLHEAPRVMLLPVSILAALAVIGGYPIFFGFGHFLAPAFPGQEELTFSVAGTEVVALVTGVAAAMIGIVAAYIVYDRQPGSAAGWQRRLRPVHALLLNKYYFDPLYDRLFVRPVDALGRFCQRVLEGGLFEGLTVGISYQVRELSRDGRRLQTGQVRWYALVMLVGAVGIVAYLSTLVAVGRF